MMHTQSSKKLTPARQCLHLQENHSLVTRWVSGNDCLVKIHVFRDVVLGELPLTIATAEVGAQSLAMGETEGVRDVQAK